MKLSKLASATALSLGLAVLPATIASATAPTTNEPAVNSTIDAPVPDVADVEEADNNFDWGWLGLLGLLGLAGLTGKREEPTRYREPDVTTRTGTTGTGTSERY